MEVNVGMGTHFSYHLQHCGSLFLAIIVETHHPHLLQWYQEPWEGCSPLEKLESSPHKVLDYRGRLYAKSPGRSSFRTDEWLLPGGPPGPLVLPMAAWRSRCLRGSSDDVPKYDMSLGPQILLDT